MFETYKKTIDKWFSPYKVSSSAYDSAYNGASYSRKSMRNWYSPSSDVNSAYSETTQKTLTNRCRDAYRNYPIARAIIDRIKLNSIGTGIRLQCRLDADLLGFTKEQANEYERIIEFKFNEWCKRCDIEDTLNFSEFQALIQTAMLLSGDVFINTIFTTINNKTELKLQVIESDRICNPNFANDTSKIVRGIEMNRWGKPLYYHIMETHPDSSILDKNANKWRKIPIYGKKTGKKRVLHAFDKASAGRPGLKRGIPFLSCVLDALRQLDKYTEAELTAAVISGFFSVFVKTESGGGLPGTLEQTETEEERGEIALSPGAIIDLLPSESIETTNPGRPNSQFEPFVAAIIKNIGASVGLPAEVLTQHFSSSYTAARGSLLQAWKLFKYQRHLVVNSFCQPVYELFLDGMVASGEITLPDYARNKELYYKTTWIGNSGGSIDPTKEVAAAEKRINIGVSTIQKEAEDISNMDWLDIQRQRDIETQLRKEAGIVSNEENNGGKTDDKERSGENMGNTTRPIKK